MAERISIGVQDFAKIRENGYFYVDKSAFIKEWWESGDDVTLIAHPRRMAHRKGGCHMRLKQAAASFLLIGLLAGCGTEKLPDPAALGNDNMERRKIYRASRNLSCDFFVICRC